MTNVTLKRVRSAGSRLSVQNAVPLWEWVSGDGSFPSRFWVCIQRSLTLTIIPLHAERLLHARHSARHLTEASLNTHSQPCSHSSPFLCPLTKWSGCQRGPTRSVPAELNWEPLGLWPVWSPRVQTWGFTLWSQHRALLLFPRPAPSLQATLRLAVISLRCLLSFSGLCLPSSEMGRLN